MAEDHRVKRTDDAKGHTYRIDDPDYGWARVRFFADGSVQLAVPVTADRPWKVAHQFLTSNRPDEAYVKLTPDPKGQA